MGRELWTYRVPLRSRLNFGQTNEERGLAWWDYSMFFVARYRGVPGLSFANVATHNHFSMVHGRRAFGSHAPVIKLAEEATADDYLALLGFLNSSVACFWMQQVFHNKGGPGGGNSKDEKWHDFYEHDGTKLRQFPLPSGEFPVEIARTLDSLAAEISGAPALSDLCWKSPDPGQPR